MVVYLPSLFVYLVHPGQWWVMGILSIGFPFTWLVFILAVCFGFDINKRLGVAVLLLWVAGMPIMKNVIGLHLPKEFVVKKQPGTLRIVQWNCMHLPGGEAWKLEGKSERLQAVQYLRKYAPDIVLVQDFTDYAANGVFSNKSLLQDTLGFRYVYFKPYYAEKLPWGEVKEGVAIFSKLPLVDSGFVQYTRKSYPANISWATVRFNHKLLRLATTHFTSMNLNTPPVSPDTLGVVQLQDSTVMRIGSIWQKLRYYQPYHVKQATMLRSFLDSSSAPTITGMDMNSVPSSYVYKLVKGDRQDAFLAKGFGFGRSYDTRLPNLRIDYLFVHNDLQIMQMTQQYMPISDHQLLIADVQWK
ncbi:MAG TPA: endonuclease/exonuclease/phosphatase family protein [Phnomibacter sp.]|nr:endonuclease/exonuclease/phosphatase family protein [Phnomibacter sp.]